MHSQITALEKLSQEESQKMVNENQAQIKKLNELQTTTQALKREKKAMELELADANVCIPPCIQTSDSHMTAKQKLNQTNQTKISELQNETNGKLDEVQRIV